MKVIITNNSLDSLLSVQISTNGGQSYSTYSVSSLKDGLTFDCSPKDLKVICDVNTLKYIQVLADGEKASSSDIDLSNYIKIKDIYVDVYENPYYGSTDYDYLSDEEKEEIDKLPEPERAIYNSRYQYYYKSRDFNPENWDYYLRLDNGTELGSFHYIEHSSDYYYYGMNGFPSDETYFIMTPSSQSYLDGDAFYTNARVHFIKHF